MHDPMTVAFDIRYPWKSKNSDFRDNFITIWHVDPEKDGSDDSCGWFLRPRHLDSDVRKQIAKDFAFDWDTVFETEGHKYNCGLFLPNGQPHLSVSAVTLNLFYKAALQVFKAKQRGDGHNYQKKAMNYLQNNLAHILFFAENPTDSMYDSITRKFEDKCEEPYTPEKRQERINSMAGIIYAYIMRDIRPWYREPKWHIHHWNIQIHPLQKITKFLFLRCSECGKRFGWNESPHSGWHDKKRWHYECGTTRIKEDA